MVQLHWGRVRARAPPPHLRELHYPLAVCLLNASVGAPPFQVAAAYSAWSFAVCAAVARCERLGRNRMLGKLVEPRLGRLPLSARPLRPAARPQHSSTGAPPLLLCL